MRNPMGLTLVLMGLGVVGLVGLACLGVGASLALPAGRDYAMRTRAAEAATFLEEIRLREEAFHMEFGAYCAADWSPALVPDAERPVPFDAAVLGWSAMDAAPDGPVRFRYRVRTDVDGVAAPNFVAEAEADLDGDGALMRMTTSSVSSRLVVTDAAGAPLAAGWE